MMKSKVLLLAGFIGLLIFSNSMSASAQEVVSMVKDLKGDVLLITGGGKEELAVTPMQELKLGDKLKIGKNGGATVLYYYSEVEEMYMENSVIEIGEMKGIMHQGESQLIENSNENTFIKIESELPVSLRSQEDFGAFTLRGNPPPDASKYFADADIHRYAVVIGISKFKDKNIPSLKYADRDANSFYDFLVSPTGGSFNKEDILLLTNENATLKNVKDGLTNFLKKAIDDDLVIVYIASHGEPEPDRPQNLYLLAHDTELDRLASTAYHMENINMDMKRYISAQRLIFLADACHAGGIASKGFGTRGFSNPINNALSALSTTKEGWAMITASRAGEVSIESDKWGNGHGAFTYFLLEGLNGKADVAGNYNGIVTISEAFDYLENKVKRETLSAQHPVITGDFDNSLPIGFLPVVAHGNGDASKPSGNKKVEFNGVLNISSEEENANIFLNNKLVGKTSKNESFIKKLPVGSAKLTIKKSGFDDYNKTVYVNPDETSNVYVAFRSVGQTHSVREAVQNVREEKKAVVKEVYVEPQINKAELRSSIDSLVKELEEMRMKQLAAEGGGVVKSKVAEVKKPEIIAQPVGVPISIKRFTANMQAQSSQRGMDILRMRVIDELIKESKVSIVERDLEYQEEILREQRLGGSILADKMYRIEIGRILGADFICFSKVYPAYDSDDLILRMEIVDTATTLIDTVECSFKADDITLANAKNIAAKIRGKIAEKRKL